MNQNDINLEGGKKYAIDDTNEAKIPFIKGSCLLITSLLFKSSYL